MNSHWTEPQEKLGAAAAAAAAATAAA